MSQVGSWGSGSGAVSTTVIQNIKNELEKKIDQAALTQIIKKIKDELQSIRNEVNKKSGGSSENLSGYVKKSDLDNYIEKDPKYRHASLGLNWWDPTWSHKSAKLWKYTFCGLTKVYFWAYNIAKDIGFDCDVIRSFDGTRTLYAQKWTDSAVICHVTCF